MTKAAEAPVEQKAVTFYAWIDRTPSSEVVHISGGEQAHDQVSGRIMRMGHKEVRFLKGKLTTSDPEVIAALRGFIARGNSYTEDVEIFLERTENPEHRARRLQQKNAVLTGEAESAKAENERLKKLLAERPTPGRRNAAPEAE